MQVMLMRLMSKGEYLIVPKGTKFKGSGKLGLKFPIPVILDLTGCRKMQNFLWENVCKSVKNYMEVIEDILN